MRKKLILSSITLVLGLMGTAQATYDTVGVYDPDDDPHHNQVDQSGTYSSHTGAAGPENVIDLATFQALIGPAFQANAGGVVNMENANGSLDGQDIIARFGVGKTKTLTVSNISGIINTGSSVKNGRTPTSGTGRLAKSDTANFVFAIGPLTGGKAGEVVTHFGGTLLGRDDANLAPKVTATFSGGGTVTAVATMPGAGVGRNEDTFFGFVAPPGQSIVSVDFNPTGGPYTNLDDVGFITSAFVVVSPKASSPDPRQGQIDVPRDAVLSWTPGASARIHDVYFGAAFADVNTASRASPKGVLANQGQEAATYDPPGLLTFGQTYYWRVDEVNDAPGASIYKGEVWSFTTEPYAYAVKPVAVTASSSEAGVGPENTINGSGLTEGLHSSANTAAWVSDKAGPQPTWIQYAFDRVYKLYEMRVWNYNGAFEPVLGFGFKDVTIEHSTDGTTWTLLKEVQFARAPGQDSYAGAAVSLGGAVAQFIRLTAKNNWGGVAPQFGLSEVQFSYVPVDPRQPVPASGTTGVEVNPTLAWRAGREAVSHRVYLGTDPNAVRNGTAPAKTVAEHRLTPGPLELGQSYYWKVVEVNEAATPTTWEGDIWSFATTESLVVDDFEGYTDSEGKRIYEAWADGFGSTNNGAQVGYAQAPFAETKVVHGGAQSMPLSYNNGGAFTISEAVRTFDTPQDWTTSGVKSLSLYFRGAADNSGQLYLKINGTKVPYNGGSGDLARPAWIPWNIDLSAVGGNLSSVTKLTIGVEGAGAKGIVYLDDLRLYPKAPEFITPADPGQTNLVALYAFEGNTKDTSGHGLDGTIKQGTLISSGRPGGGSALRIEQTGYVNLGNPPSLDFGTGDWTVTAWFKTMLKGLGDANKGTIYAKGGDGTGGQRYALIMSETAEGAVSLICDDDAAKYTTDSKSKTNDDQWHFVAAQREGTALRIYIDGQLEGTTAIPSAYNLAGTSQHDAYIGAIVNHADGNLYKLYSGLIDDVRLYNRALSPAEILWLAGYTGPVAKPF
ncbi:MAG: discoidin domain-containing protein [Planctomycetes bacterium]|nr:discoidin domain-containing protein [Planctomycetota bacterium]